MRCRQIRTEPEYDFQQFIEAGATRKINATPGVWGAGDHALTARPATPAALPNGADDVMNYITGVEGASDLVSHATSRGEPDDVINNHTWSRGCW